MVDTTTPAKDQTDEHDNPIVRIALALERMLPLLIELVKHSEAGTHRR